MSVKACSHGGSKPHSNKNKHWSRLVYMLIFGLLLNLAGAVMWALAALQFLFVITSGKDNVQLRRFGRSLAQFVEQALMYVSYNTETRPFPFADWPDEGGLMPDGANNPDDGDVKPASSSATDAKTAKAESSTPHEAVSAQAMDEEAASDDAASDASDGHQKPTSNG